MGLNFTQKSVWNPYYLGSLCANSFPLNMQECGPRFTLKLRSLQHGTFDTKGGEYEWVHKVAFEWFLLGIYIDLIC